MSEDFFEKNGLEIEYGEVVVGETYPIYGMITNVISDEPGFVEVEINFTIKAKLNIEEDNFRIIKSRAFEAGVFVSKIKSIDETTGIITVDCSTVVFGKQPEVEVQ
jgi:hypothetical protein